MEAATLETRLAALRERNAHETLPLWSAGCDPTESLSLLQTVTQPWGALLRAEAFLRKGMPAEAQIEVEALPAELPPGITRMKAVLEQKIALHPSRGDSAGGDGSSAQGEGALQQWLMRVREFRTRS